MGIAINVGGKKGGSGKSTTVINVAGALAHSGHEVIVLDCDDNQTCLKFFQRRKGVYEALTSNDFSKYENDPVQMKFIKDYIKKWGGIEAVIQNHPYVECAAKSADENITQDIRNLKNKYDYVIVDTGGYQNNAFKSALAACDMTYIPVQPSQLEIEQLPPVLGLIKELEENFSIAVPDFSIDARVIINGIEAKKGSKNNRLKQALLQAKEYISCSGVQMPRREAVMSLMEPGLFLHDVKDPGRGTYDVLVQEINGDRALSFVKGQMDEMVEEA